MMQPPQRPPDKTAPPKDMDVVKEQMPHPCASSRKQGRRQAAILRFHQLARPYRRAEKVWIWAEIKRPSGPPWARSRERPT